MQHGVQMFGELRLVRQAPPGSSHQLESVLFSFERDTDHTVVYREQWTKPKGDDRWMCSRLVTVFDGREIDLEAADLWDFAFVCEGHEYQDSYMGKRAITRKFFVPAWISLPWVSLAERETLR